MRAFGRGAARLSDRVPAMQARALGETASCKSRTKRVVAIAGIFSDGGSISLSVSHFGVSESFR